MSDAEEALATIEQAALRDDKYIAQTTVAALRDAGVLGATERYEWRRDLTFDSVRLFRLPGNFINEVDESFADAPQTIGELRSGRSQNGADWTPRDLLLKLLREHDSGECVLTDLVVGMRMSNGRAGYWNACSNSIIACGLLSQAAMRIVKDAPE